MRKNTPLLLLVTAFLSILQIQAHTSSLDFEGKDAIAASLMESFGSPTVEIQVASSSKTSTITNIRRVGNILSHHSDYNVCGCSFQVKVKSPTTYHFQHHYRIGLGTNKIPHLFSKSLNFASIDFYVFNANNLAPSLKIFKDIIASKPLRDFKNNIHLKNGIRNSNLTSYPKAVLRLPFYEQRGHN